MKKTTVLIDGEYIGVSYGDNPDEPIRCIRKVIKVDGKSQFLLSGGTDSQKFKWTDREKYDYDYLQFNS